MYLSIYVSDRMCIHVYVEHYLFENLHDTLLSVKWAYVIFQINNSFHIINFIIYRMQIYCPIVVSRFKICFIVCESIVVGLYNHWRVIIVFDVAIIHKRPLPTVYHVNPPADR